MERILGESYTQIRVIDDKGVTIAIIDEFDATPIVDGYTVVLKPSYELERKCVHEQFKNI